MTKKLLYQGQPGTSSAAAYTASQLTTIDAATVCNADGSAYTLDVWLVPDGGAAADATKVYTGLSVGANTQVSLPLLVNHALEGGSELHLSASTADKLTVTVSGRVG